MQYRVIHNHSAELPSAILDAANAPERSEATDAALQALEHALLRWGHASGEAAEQALDAAEQAVLDTLPAATHWGYGSGMPGCLFDNGPHFASTQEDAIEGVLWCFHGTGNESDLSTEELEQARADLRDSGIHYFPSERRDELGASVVEVWQEQGPCPDNEY